MHVEAPAEQHMRISVWLLVRGIPWRSLSHPLITPRLLSKSQQQHQVSACSEDDMIGALGIEDSRHLRTADYEYIHSSSED